MTIVGNKAAIIQFAKKFPELNQELVTFLFNGKNRDIM